MRHHSFPALALFLIGCGSSGTASVAEHSSDSGVPDTGSVAPHDGGAHEGGSPSDASVETPEDAAGETPEDAGGSPMDGGIPLDGPDDALGPAIGNGPPKITPGAPIQAPDGVWTKIPFPDAYCRDHSQPYLAVRLNGNSKKVAIYLEGGGGCFSDTTCLMTVNYPTYTFNAGVFDFKNANNPLRDWNIFYVPYCTGDAHAGSNPAGVPGPMTGPQKFTGYTNLQLYLSRILATVPDATDELLTGVSAGGFGAGVNMSLVAGNAPATVERFTMLDDSAPPMSNKILKPCFQETWRTVWGFDDTFLRDCGDACPDRNDYFTDWVKYLMKRYATGTFGAKFRGGLISYTGDSTMSMGFGYAANDCNDKAISPALTEAQYREGLLDFRAMVQNETASFGTYYMKGTTHTILATSTFYSMQVGGVKLVDWVNDLLSHEQATHVGP